MIRSRKKLVKNDNRRDYIKPDKRINNISDENRKSVIMEKRFNKA